MKVASITKSILGVKGPSMRRAMTMPNVVPTKPASAVAKITTPNNAVGTPNDDRDADFSVDTNIRKRYMDIAKLRIFLNETFGEGKWRMKVCFMIDTLEDRTDHLKIRNNDCHIFTFRELKLVRPKFTFWNPILTSVGGNRVSLHSLQCRLIQ